MLLTPACLADLKHHSVLCGAGFTVEQRYWVFRNASGEATQRKTEVHTDHSSILSAGVVR